MKRSLKPLVWAIPSVLPLISSWVAAVDFEPQNKALLTLLASTKVSKKAVPVKGKPVDVWYVKNGKAIQRAAFIEKGVYEPNCTHTWAIGLDGAGKVTDVRVIEMSCPHAFPTKTEAFMSQFKGKGKADAAALPKNVDVIAKATGSSQLAAEAVGRAILNFEAVKGQL